MAKFPARRNIGAQAEQLRAKVGGSMPWVRLDDDFSNHPKVIKAGPLGIAMQVAALCYCNHYLTDGFIPTSIVPALLNLDGLGMRMWNGELFGGGEDAAWHMIVEDLVNAGLWEQAEGGYMIHDYLDYQPSREQVMAEREQKRAAGSKGGIASAQARAKAPAQAESKPVPVPVPVPVPDPDSKDNGAVAPVAQPSSETTPGKPDKPKTPNRQRERDALFDAIAEVCCVDPATAGASIGNVKVALLKAKPPYSADEVMAFGRWHNSDEFRRKKGPPSLWTLKEKIGIVRNGNGNKPAPSVAKLQTSAEVAAEFARLNPRKAKP